MNRKETLNIWQDIKDGISFIKENHGFPVFSLSASIFEGIYYGSIWFLFPIIMVQAGIQHGFQLGVYEIITIFFAGFCGYLADKCGWKNINIIGRLLIIAGSIMLIITQEINTLIIIGVCIGLGNNLFYGASMHVLEQTDIDHKKDGRYIAFQRIILNVAYVIMPLIMGYVYYAFGLQVSITILAILIITLATTMILFTYRVSSHIIASSHTED